MSYFPEMSFTHATPDSSDSNSESYNSRMTIDHKVYTPFLAELNPINYEVMLFYKAADFEDVDEDS